MNNYCFVCDKEYSPDNIKPIYFYNDDEELVKISRITYKGQTIPLCNEHLRTTILPYLILKGTRFII